MSHSVWGSFGMFQMHFCCISSCLMYNAIWLFLYGGCWLEPFSIYPGPLLDGSDHKMIRLSTHVHAYLPVILVYIKCGSHLMNHLCPNQCCHSHDRCFSEKWNYGVNKIAKTVKIFVEIGSIEADCPESIVTKVDIVM